MEKHEKTFLTTLIIVLILFCIVTFISIRQNEEMIEELSEQLSFFDDCLFETIKTQGTIIRTQNAILETIDMLIGRGII